MRMCVLVLGGGIVKGEDFRILWVETLKPRMSNCCDDANRVIILNLFSLSKHSLVSQKSFKIFADCQKLVAWVSQIF